MLPRSSTDLANAFAHSEAPQLAFRVWGRFEVQVFRVLGLGFRFGAIWVLKGLLGERFVLLNQPWV